MISREQQIIEEIKLELNREPMERSEKKFRDNARAILVRIDQLKRSIESAKNAIEKEEKNLERLQLVKVGDNTTTFASKSCPPHDDEEDDEVDL